MSEAPPEIAGRLNSLPARAHEHRLRTGRPLVTLTYAQSLDGSIAARRDARLELSGPQTLRLTHHLRSVHDAILVGIGTVLADDPRLTARLVQGKNPRPIIVDSHLRTPPTARLLTEREAAPLIATGENPPPASKTTLESLGVQTLSLPVDSAGLIDLASLLNKLGEMGIDSVMVEGGARIITSFLTQRLADWMLVTICPVLVGGLHVLENGGVTADSTFPRLCSPQYAQMGADCIVWGDLSREVE